MKTEIFTNESILELIRFINNIKSSTTDIGYKYHLECLLLRLTPKKRNSAQQNLELRFYYEAMAFYRNNSFNIAINQIDKFLFYLQEKLEQTINESFILSEEITTTIFLIEESNKIFNFNEIGRIHIFYANYLAEEKKQQVAFASWNEGEFYSPFFN